MLEHNGNSNVPRRWGWAVALAAATLIPLQFVARTSAAAPQETAKLQELIRAAQAAERAQAEVERAKAIQAGVELAALEKKLSEAARRESQEKLTEVNRARLEIASAMARAEKARAQASQADQVDAKRAEMMAQIEKARRAQRDMVQKDDLASRIRGLAERLERLAMEQRELTEELRQLERLAAPAK